MLLGAIRAGYVCFPISVRNSPGAVAHLLAKTGVDLLIVGPEASFEHLAAAALQQLAETGERLPQLAVHPVYEDLYGKDKDAVFEPLPPLQVDAGDLAMYMHSSGEFHEVITMSQGLTSDTRLHGVPEAYSVHIQSAANDGPHPM